MNSNIMTTCSLPIVFHDSIFASPKTTRSRATMFSRVSIAAIGMVPFASVIQIYAGNFT